MAELQPDARILDGANLWQPKCAQLSSSICQAHSPKLTLAPRGTDSWWCNQTAEGLCPDPENRKVCPGHAPPDGPAPRNSGCRKSPSAAPVPPSTPAMPKADFVGCFKDHTPSGVCDLPYVIVSAAAPFALLSKKLKAAAAQNGGCSNAEGNLPCFTGPMTPCACRFFSSVLRLSV